MRMDSGPTLLGDRQTRTRRDHESKERKKRHGEDKTNQEASPVLFTASVIPLWLVQGLVCSDASNAVVTGEFVVVFKQTARRNGEPNLKSTSDGLEHSTHGSSISSVKWRSSAVAEKRSGDVPGPAVAEEGAPVCRFCAFPAIISFLACLSLISVVAPCVASSLIEIMHPYTTSFPLSCRHFWLALLCFHLLFE